MKEDSFDLLVVGCGLAGAVIARKCAESGKKVRILERRSHIGGNLYDETDEYGIRIHKYGPHIFHTDSEEVLSFIQKYGEWEPFELKCGAEINGVCTPSPFNYQTIDDFYAPAEAARLKEHIEKAFPGRKTATVVEALNCEDSLVRGYAQFLFDHDFSLYTAKQWGVSASEIDPSVLKRVPLRFDYDDRYFYDPYQLMPKHGYTAFFENLLKHPKIEVILGEDALQNLSVSPDGSRLLWKGESCPFPVVYTGPLDELFGHCFGRLPYRSLRFEWKHDAVASFQKDAVVAYPQAEGYTRIVEYKKLPPQMVEGSTYEVEYPLPYEFGKEQEPYYPLLTEESQARYARYRSAAEKIENLVCCGRLADFRYYDMDDAILRALEVSSELLAR